MSLGSLAGAGGRLPHLSAMEHAFARSLGHLDVRTGASELGGFGARALATGNRIAFRDAAPSPSLVAHEVTHALQSERGGSVRSLVAPRGSAAEIEADANAAAVLRAGPGARLPRVVAPPAGQVHLAPNGDGSISGDQEALLRAWIEADGATKKPSFDPSLRPFATPGTQGTFGNAAPTDNEMLRTWIGSDTSLPMKPFKGSGLPKFGVGLSHDSNDPFAKKYDNSVCHTNCHGVVYQRTPPPAPSWQPPDKATGDAAVAKEAQTTEETVDQIELQVLTAKSQAIEAATKTGKLPADLQTLWQQATLAAESLRITVPALARAKAGPPPKPVVPAPAPKSPAPAPVPSVDVDATAAEAARVAIDGFYWALLDALQKKEADELAFTFSWNRVHQHQAQAEPPCPGGCHSSPPPKWNDTPIFVTPERHSPTVKAREKALMIAASPDQWKTALDDFDKTSTKELEQLLVSLLPTDSKELQQLEHSRNLLDRIHDLQGEQANGIRIPAVFYPENDVESDGKAKGYSWYLFLYQQPDGVWVLKDLTSNQIFTNKEGGDAKSGIESFALTNGGDIMGPVPDVLKKYPTGVLTDLMKQLDSKLHMPKGMLYYTLPGGRAGTVETKAEWELSDWLRAIGLTLAAIGLVALSAGAGTPAALAFVASGLVGAAGTKAGLEEMERQGIATDSDRARAYLTIAQDLVGALAGGLGVIAKAPATFGQLAAFANRVYLPVRTVGLGLDVAQAAVMTHDFVENLRAISSQPASKERTVGIIKLVAMGLAMGALSFVAIKGGVHELATASARPRVVMGEDGAYRLIGPDGLPVPDVPGGKLRFKAEVSKTEVDPSVGDKSVVVDLERNADGLVTRVGVRKGPGASAEDVALHERIAATVATYGGLQGRIRLAWRQILAKFGVRRPPLELELEVTKLEEAARMRIRRLTAPGASDAEINAATSELAIIEEHLAKAKQRAQASLTSPPETAAQRAQIWMKEAPEGLPPAPKGTQWVKNEAGVWDLVESGPRNGVEVRAGYDESGQFTGFTNRSQVDRARIVGRDVNEVKDRLKELGYTVDHPAGAANPRIRRMGNFNEGMVDLNVAPDGTVQMGFTETEAAVQKRLEARLKGTPGEQALEAAKAAADAKPGTRVVLLEGIYDLGATWPETIKVNGGRDALVQRLVARGVGLSDAERIIDTLNANTRPLQAVRGTTPLRKYPYAAQYGGAVPPGGEVHHIDPLYLAGTHEALVGLGADAHDAVHELFNSLKLPPGSKLPGKALEPNALRAAIPNTAWKPGVATIHGPNATQPGFVDYGAL